MILREYGQSRPIQILLVEDNPSDAELTMETLTFGKLRNPMCLVEDGEEAMKLLRRKDSFAHAPRPDLILLDLNLPRKDGRQVLAEMKADAQLREIPVVVLTASQVDRDILSTYKLDEGCYLTKPLVFGQFLEAVRSIGRFGLTVVDESQSGV